MDLLGVSEASHSKVIRLLDYAILVDEILALDDAVNYVVIASVEGGIIYSKTKYTERLIDEKEEKVLASDLSVMKLMQGLYNDSMGRVTCMLTLREKIHQLVYFVDHLTIYVSCERDMDTKKIVEVKKKIESIIKKSV